MEKKRIYTYNSPWVIYGLSWSSRVNRPFRLAIGSFLEDYTNRVDVIQLNEETDQFEVVCGFEHPYPPTKCMWIPDKNSNRPDLLATTGDYLRLWEVGSNQRSIKLKSLLTNNKSSEFCAPLSSFDWNETDPSLLATSSIDTTCTIWNIETGQAKTQLIAHDKEVFDIAFARGTDLFASVGADGSLRMFDLRNLEHSTIIYETPSFVPLLRLCWNKQDPNYLATIQQDSPKVIILDIRVPSVPAAELVFHKSAVNGISWAPHSSCHICTVSDDKQALIWDLSSMPKPIEDPLLTYNALAEINQLSWSSSQPDWIAIAFSSHLQILKV
ncbi:hypothetical protein ACTFIW_004739 [Dictyostelium discoideum]